jgi:NADH:ubiquinone oxidoreductase subunit 5 (subunit L)/multisubunit Na+/H+ antiporter MnhA subunit
VHAESTELALTVLSALLALAGIGLAYRWVLRGWPNRTAALAARHPGLYDLFRAGWWWDAILTRLFGGLAWAAGRLSVWFDDSIIDGVLHSTGRVSRELSRAIRRAQMGQVQAYAVATLLGVNLLLVVVLLW